MSLETVKERRNLPFLKKGMKVELCYGSVKKRGIVINGNSGLNIDVLFEGEDQTSNCHPTWAMKYFDDEENIIAEFGE